MIYIAVFSKLIEPPRDRLPKERQLFSNTDLRKLIVPIIIEQVLVMMVGMVGTMMVSYSGEAAMSGVSLSEMINGIFQYVFSALAAGGTIVVSQYIGSRDMNKAQKSSNQLVMVATLIALIFMGGVLIGNRPLLSLLFGRIEADVMDAALTYLIITAFSYPFVAAYNAFSALFRAMGHSKINMKVSLMMNIINVLCNYIGVFRMGGGAEAVGISVLISRVFAAAVLFVLLLNKKYEISLSPKNIFTWDMDLIKRILGIAIPNGVETGAFQVSRVALTSIIATFGTAQIAANGVAVSLDNFNSIVNSSISLAIPTVIGQCMGARDHEAATYYAKKLLLIAQIGSVFLCTGVFLSLPFVLDLYELSADARWYVHTLVAMHCLWTILFGTSSGPMPSVLRAAGDVKFTMFWAIAGLAIGRVGGSYLFAIIFDMGIIGMWMAMPPHWLFNSISSYLRFRSGKWKEKRVI
ncbi:MAG: MATE family efflux transporter [Clostridia bacterium]|nr:MATE family efflux transporter [Clostridia bacterium]